MAYIVHTAEEVEAYLRDVAHLSAAGRQRVTEAYLRDLAESADEFLKRSPVAHESYTFQYEFVLIDSGYCFSFRFIADGSAMAYGVVRVLYVDCESQPVPT